MGTLLRAGSPAPTPSSCSHHDQTTSSYTGRPRLQDNAATAGQYHDHSVLTETSFVLKSSRTGTTLGCSLLPILSLPWSSSGFLLLSFCGGPSPGPSMFSPRLQLEASYSLQFAETVDRMRRYANLKEYIEGAEQELLAQS